MKLLIVPVMFLSLMAATGAAQKRKARPAPSKAEPVIDMHIHASSLSEFGGGEISACTGDQNTLAITVDPKLPFAIADVMQCKRPIKASASDDALMRETIAELKKHNVRRAVALGGLELVSKWTYEGNGLFIPALNFSGRKTPAEEYRSLYAGGKLKVFGEIGPQYRGFAPGDAVYAEYFKLAEELDIPVGIHLGEGPPGGVHTIGPPTYRVQLGSPLLLEELIVRHPKLRIYVMHYGSPLIDEMIAMMYLHPNLYVDVSANNWGLPRKQFYDHLRRMVEAGFVKRIMFGSDQMAWPGTIGESIKSIENAPFLSRAQKRDIFYNNAARFLRLSPDEIAADHR